MLPGHLFSEISLFLIGMMPASHCKSAGPASLDAPRNGILRAKVALGHAITRFIGRNSIEGADEPTGPASHAGFRPMANR
jgi:hypothetical protein